MADEVREDGSGHSDSSDDGSDGSEDVELLVTGRERRKTAGNRYDRDMVVEEAGDDDEPDEVTLLFAEGDEEDDEEFRSEGSDEDAMSSSDDDDQGPEAGAEDMEGEKELQKQAKEDKARKRKAELALTSTAGLRKRVKIDPTQQKPSPQKPAKKERVTWLPDQDKSTARSSLRKQTIIHREETLARLKQSEAQSKKMKVLKEKRDKERAKDAPKAMTQADRLEEAAKIERANAKSLNRWEAMEKKRTEDQAAKLEELKNRRLQGPVVTLWSGRAYYRGPRPSQVWKDPAEENPTEPKKRGRKPKGYHEQMAALKAAGESVPVSGQQIPQPPSVTGNSQPPNPSDTLSEPPTTFTQAQSVTGTPQPQTPAESQSQPQKHSNLFLSGIHEYASMQSDVTEITTANLGTHKSVPDEGTALQQDPKPADPMNSEPTEPKKEEIANPDVQMISANLPPLSDPLPNDSSTGQILPVLNPSTSTPISSLAAPPAEPIEEGYTTKNLVILDKFEDLSETSRKEYGLFYNSRKSAKPVKHNPELCPITMQPARYRDPTTGIGYANMFAYKVLQELREHKFTWSTMLGCYVGREGTRVARGVPEGFPGR